MLPQQNNIVGFKSDSVNEDISIFLNDEKFSKGTRVAYLNDIKTFFTFMNKSFDNLTIQDLQYENKDILRFRNHLINNLNLSKSTVNTKIAALQSLYAFLKRNRYDIKYNIDCEVFKIGKLKAKTKSYGDLSPEEVDTMIILVQKQVKGYEKMMLIKLATRTSYREDTLLNLEWDNLQPDYDKNCCFVNTVEEKNNKEMSQPITLDMYYDLLKIKELTYYKRYNNNKIFNLTTKTLWNMMNTLKEEMEIHPNRKIVFHSFRNFAPNYIIDTEGDFRAAQLQTGHSDINTLWKHYVNKQRDVSQSAGLMLDEKLDQDAFNNLTLDEMRQLLNNTKNGIRTQLLRESTKLINSRSDIKESV